MVRTSPKLLTPAWTLFKPHAEQRKLWTCPARFVAVPAGRGSGKTELLKRRLVRFLPVKKPWPKPMYFYGAPTQEQANRISWDHFLALIPENWIEKISLQPRMIRTIFGSELHIVGLDKPERIEGPQWDGGGLDESCDLKPGTFDRSVVPALVWREGWCWRVGVPKRQGRSAAEFKKFFFDCIAGNYANGAGFRWASKDIVPDDVLRQAQQNLDPKDFREQFEAMFETAGGGVYYAFDRKYNVRPCAYDRKMSIVVGMDFNVAPMAWMLGHVRGNERGACIVEWFDEVYVSNDANTDGCLEILYERYKGHQGGWQFYGDASAKARKTSANESDIAKIRAHGGFKSAGRTVHFSKANPPVKDRFAAVNAMFCNAAGARRMFIDDRCENLIRCLEGVYYDPKTQEPSGENHSTDAMGYPIYKKFRVRIPIDQTVISLGSVET